jgi:hypothetical protein
MTCYLVRAGGEPVALVASIELACEIVFTQPPGYYIVDKIQADPLDSGARARAARRSTRHPDGRHGDGPRVRLGRTIPPPQSRHTNRSTTPLIPSDPEST